MIDLSTPKLFDRIYGEAHLDTLPIRSVIAHEGNPAMYYTWTDQGWVDINGEPNDSVPDLVRQFPGIYLVRSLPDPDLTIERYKWAFRDSAWSGARAHGMGIEDVRDAIRTFHLEDENFPVGSGMRIQSADYRERVPAGSTVVLGNPDHWSTFGLYLREPDQWTQLLGGAPHRRQPPPGQTYVDLVGGEHVEQEWLIRPATPEDAIAILDFQSQVWQVGLAAKARSRWCCAFETIMGRVGIDMQSMRRAQFGRLGVTNPVGVAQARALPVGTILSWKSTEHPATRQAWYVRDDDDPHADNPAGTRLLCGFRDDNRAMRHFAAVMEVIYAPVTDGPILNEAVYPGQMLDHLPVGTWLSNSEAGGVTYAVAQDHQMAALNGTEANRGPVEGSRIPDIGDYSVAEVGRVWVRWIPGMVMQPPAPSRLGAESQLVETVAALQATANTDPF